MKQNIMLIGFMGTGKSTVSQKLKEISGMKEVDLDAYIVERAGKSINDIFAQQGEETFRDMESTYLKEILEQKGLILSCGGGTIIRQENVEEMKKKGEIVLLTATAKTIYERIKDKNDRPILSGHMNVEYIEKLMEKRKDYYEKAADILVETDGKSVEEICEIIISKTFLHNYTK